MKLFCVFLLCFCFNFFGYKKDDMIQKEVAICIDNFDNISDEYQYKILDLRYPITIVSICHINQKNSKNDKEFIKKLDFNAKNSTIFAKGNKNELKSILLDLTNILKLSTSCVVIFDAKNLNEIDIYDCLKESVFELYKNGIVFKLFSDLK